MRLEVEGSRGPVESLDEDLHAAIAEILDLDLGEVEARSDLTFIQLGGNSIKALELTFRLDAVGKCIDVETILTRETSISLLSLALQQRPNDVSESNDLKESLDGNLSLTGYAPSVEASGTAFFEEAGQHLNCSVKDIEHVLPLTPQQRGLWLGSLQAPGAYISRWRYQVAAGVDLVRLERAWRKTLKAHPILRTRILSLSDSNLHQVVLKADHHEVRGDLVHQTSITAEENNSLFDISLDSESQPRSLDIVCHHALYDRWSIRLVLQDVQFAYDNDEVPHLRPSYIPFIRLLNAQDIESLQETWLKAFGSESAVAAPAIRDSESFALASDLIGETVSSSSLGHFTLAETITAAWSYVCSRHCGSSRVSFGLTVSGRHVPLPDIVNMSFPTFNTLPFIADVSEDDTVSTFLMGIKSRMGHLRRMQHLDVQTISAISSACYETCRFNSVVVVQEDMSATQEPKDYLFGAKRLLSFETKQSAPLVLECTPNGEEVTFAMKYDPAYVHPVEAKSLLNHLKAAFEQLCSASDEALVELDLCDQYDLQMIKRWIRPNLPLERATLHAIVQEAAKTRLDSVAIWQTDKSLTYGALINRSRSVMKKILDRGSGRSPNIGVCFEKSAYAVVAMLGSSMSGRTFVPIDASNPFHRIMQLVENAQIDLILCSRTTAPQFENEDVEVMIIDETTCPDLQAFGNDLLVSSDSRSHVYIIYTSGSTGEPKGVVLTQQALCTTLKALSKHLEFSADTRSLQFSSFAFDMSVHDIWCTLLEGGVVCMPTEAERFELGDFISRSKCNYAMLTPSVALTLTDREWAMFQKLSVSGEPLQKSVIRSALQADVKFWNTYGPTESCIICITEQIKKADTSPSRLGYSMAASSWIIDAHNPHRLAPVGCFGELALSGYTLASGYYRDKTKTEHAFAAGLKWTRHFPNHVLDRVYRTGDLARYNYDGSIEFGGRLGGYVKIAGNRVDLGEIEETLHSKCGLMKVSVQYCQVGRDNARDMLVGFQSIPGALQNENLLALPVTTELRAKAFRAFSKLKALLPVYMVPVLYVPVNRLPYNTAGKLDKRRLVNLVSDTAVDEMLANYSIDVQTCGEKEEEEERDVLEESDLPPEAAILRDSWAKVLNITSSTISSQSNFFRLGGDSLRALDLVAHLRQSGQRISVSDIFRCPRLRDMAFRVKRVTKGDLNLMSKEIWNPEERERMLASACRSLRLAKQQIQTIMPCTPLQIQMLASSAQSASTYLHRECFTLMPDVTSAELSNVFQHLSATNELLRSKVTVDQETGQFALVVLEQFLPSQFIQRKGDLQSYLTLKQTSVGIERDLTRFVLLENGQERVLVWEIHHSIYDGYSMVLLVKQIRSEILRFRQPTSKDRVVDPSITPKFEDFVRYINQADQQKAKEFWSEYLYNAPKPDLTFVKSADYDHSPATNAKVTSSLAFEAPQSAITTAVYIRAAFAITLSQYTTNTDIVFSSTNNGRDLPVDRIEKLAGPTFSTLPVRCIIDKNETLSAMLSRMQVDAANIASYQYISPDSISSLGANYEQACKVLVHLLIQSATDEAPAEDLENLGYKVMPDISPMTLPIPFNLVVTPKETSIEFDVIYDNALFSRQQIDLFLDQFLSITEQVLTAQDTILVREMYSLSETNRKAYLDIQPETRHQDRFAGLTIPDLVFKDLHKRAEDQALYSTASSFTYGHVFGHVSALAEEIMRCVRSDHQYVAMCYEKSPWAIMVQLAILMAGHAYVLIDKSWPMARKQTVLSLTECPLLILSNETSQNMHDVPVRTIVFDGKQLDKYSLPPKPLISRARPEDAAYVIFTSGSTGTPKGVIVQHEAICRTVSAYAERLHFTHQTRSLLFASFSFDAAVMETWAVLAAGGVLCIADDEERVSDLDSFVARSQVDSVALTPTSAMLLDPSQETCIRTLLFCGERCQPRDLKRWAKPDITFVNAYGPSETSVNAVMNTNFSLADLDNIGTSMGGGLWVVSPQNCNELVPVGGIGELLVTGPVLAREYLGDAEKTLQRFVQPQWSDWTQASGQRAYKTGDLVQLGADGSLRFIGRHDGQLKINGVRIEAEEIETAIQESDINVNSVAVGTYAAADTNHELVLFFVPSTHVQTRDMPVRILPLEQSHESTIVGLHELLSARLPQTHVPSMYVPVSTVPQSNTGKKDRKALSQALPDLHRAQLELYRYTNYEQAHTTSSSTWSTEIDLSATEEALITLWTQVLPMRKSNAPLNRRSHFIQAGGDSISAIKISSLARSKGMELPVGLIYSNPILADMAAALDDKGNLVSELSDLASPSPFAMLDADAISPVMSRGGHEGRKPPTDYFDLPAR